MIRSLATLGAFLLLAACAQKPVVHHGLSNDGYGFTSNSPHLPPPQTLMPSTTR